MPFIRALIAAIILFILAALMTWLFQTSLSPLVSPLSKEYVQGSDEWLSLAMKSAHNDGQAAFELAQYFAKKSETKESVLWFNQAIRLGYEGANVALASLYFANEEFELAKKTLSLPQFPKDASYQLLAIQIAVEVGDVDYVQSHYQQLTHFDKGQAFLKTLIKYQVIEGVKEGLYASEAAPVLACNNPVQFIATNLRDLAHSDHLIKEVNKHPLSKYFCFNPVQYQPITSLGCNTAKWGSAVSAIECDESLWRDKSIPTHTRYLAVLLPQGGANVHKGILYLDRADSLDVLLHELTHLLGFIDEYPLPKDHIACAENQTTAWAYNIAVLPEVYQGSQEALREQILSLLPWKKFIHADTPILQSSKKGWVLGTPAEYSDKVGVFPSKTCDMSLKESFKPLTRATMLTYNEMEFPMLYLDFLKADAERYRMPSYHFNIAKALWLKGEEQAAKRWFSLLQP